MDELDEILGAYSNHLLEVAGGVYLRDDTNKLTHTKAKAAILKLHERELLEARIDEHNLVFTKTGELDEADLAEWSLDRLKELGVDDAID